ncbi:hypothetical protein QBC38DRAFT_449923 [Podospora fimiseda]|uniref:Uncharacterized protein n=1 Tax=Podospora fimiseda TaxID=252190 RepID=A0AAN6YKT4_9PEZI|nr:hypothetical protein QBC38DRAFT_449923 [Podospora fimiseda]
MAPHLLTNRQFSSNSQFPSVSSPKKLGPAIHPAAIFGIVAGVIIFLVFCFYIVFFCILKKALTNKDYGVLHTLRRATSCRHRHNNVGMNMTNSAGPGMYAPGFGHYHQEGQGYMGGGQFPGGGGMPPGYYNNAGNDGFGHEFKGAHGDGGGGFGGGHHGGDAGGMGGGTTGGGGAGATGGN